MSYAILERLLDEEVERAEKRIVELKSRFDEDPIHMMTRNGSELVKEIYILRQLITFRNAFIRAEGNETTIAEYAAEFFDGAIDALTTFNLESSTNAVYNALENEGGLSGRKVVLNIAKRIRRLA